MSDPTPQHVYFQDPGGPVEPVETANSNSALANGCEPDVASPDDIALANGGVLNGNVSLEIQCCGTLIKNKIGAEYPWSFAMTTSLE